MTEIEILEQINKRLGTIEAYFKTQTRIAELGSHNNVITMLKHHISECPNFIGFEYKEIRSAPNEPRYSEVYLKTHCIHCGEDKSSTVVASGAWPDALKDYIKELNQDFAKPPAPKPQANNITSHISLNDINDTNDT